jgi:uncharacterized membrane protein YhaH (DUF805 family)
MALYNVTELYAATTAVELINFANNSTGNILTPLFVLAVFFVTMLVVKRLNDVAESIMAASFVAFILSLIFRYADLINFMWVIAYLILLAGALLYVYLIKKSY